MSQSVPGEGGSEDTAGERVGCVGLPPGMSRDRYFEKLATLEADGTLRQLPKPSVLRRWRREAPERTIFTISAWQLITHRPPRTGYRGLKEELSSEQLAEAGHFADTPTVRQAAERTFAAARELAADAVVFHSPPDFTPSTANRAVFQRFFSEIATSEARAGVRCVWSPQGLWETGTALRLAEQCGVLLALNPLVPEEQERIEGEEAYLRISVTGSAPSVDEGRLYDIADQVANVDRAWVLLATPDAWRDARRLRRFLSESSAG